MKQRTIDEMREIVTEALDDWRVPSHQQVGYLQDLLELVLAKLDPVALRQWKAKFATTGDVRLTVTPSPWDTVLDQAAVEQSVIDHDADEAITAEEAGVPYDALPTETPVFGRELHGFLARSYQRTIDEAERKFRPDMTPTQES